MLADGWPALEPCLAAQALLASHAHRAGLTAKHAMLAKRGSCRPLYRFPRQSPVDPDKENTLHFRV